MDLGMILLIIGIILVIAGFITLCVANDVEKLTFVERLTFFSFVFLTAGAFCIVQALISFQIIIT